jgi:hypothetical protein
MLKKISDSISSFNNLYKVIDNNSNYCNYYKRIFFLLKFKFFNPNLIKTLKITYLSQFIN